MKLDDIDRERYSCAMFALGLSYGMLCAERAGRRVSDEEMRELGLLLQRIRVLNNESVGRADEEEP